MKTYRSAMPDLHKLTLGTMSLGWSFDKTVDYIKVVRAAMEAGLPLHTSHIYNGGQTVNMVKLAFREAPSQVTPVIAKVYCYNAAQIRLDVEEMLERLHIDQIAVGQLAKNDHRQREIVDDILNQGPMFDTICELKEKGMVGHWVFEIFQKFSADALKAMQNDLFDSVTFYYNALERETSADTWNEIESKKLPIIALRGLSGGLVEPANEKNAGKPGKPAEMVDRRKELEAVFEESGCGSWPEFSLRFLCSNAQVKTVVVGTANADRLKSNIELAQNAAPLPSSVVEKVIEHQNKWAAARTFDPNSPYN